MRFEFDKIPVNTLVGATLGVFNSICKGRKVGNNYRTKYYLTKFVAALLTPLSIIEEWRYDNKLTNKELEIEQPPLFILGHWRSGTTFVHNVLSCDKQFGYTTTYQTVFPNIMLFGQPFFKWIMGNIMPNKRPMDSLELQPDFPQEEEFALSGVTKCNYYNFWFFPEDMLEYCDKYLIMKDITEDEQREFDNAFERLVRISMWNSGGRRYLSKNPPHTGRVKELLKLFPNAKFIYLMRNPYTVFESTRGFFTKTIQPLKLHDRTDDQIEADAVEVYRRLYDKYQEDKVLIPKGNLFEMKFEDFEADPIAMTKRIYESLSLDGIEQALPAMESYVGAKRGHKKNRWDYSERTVEIVEREWSRSVSDWGYTLDTERKG